MYEQLDNNTNKVDSTISIYTDEAKPFNLLSEVEGNSQESRQDDFTPYLGSFEGDVDYSFLDSKQLTLSPRFLPSWLKDYCIALADNLLVPVALPTQYVLAILSTALADKAMVEGRTTQHQVPPIFWALTALEPGGGKSPTVKALRKPIELYQARKNRETKASRLRSQMEAKAAESKLKKITEQPSETETNDTELLEIERARRGIIPALSMYLDSSTTEGLKKQLQEQGGKVAILTDEGGVFDIISGLYSGGQSDIDILLQGYDGAIVRTARAGEGAIEVAAHIPMGITVQPETLKALGSKNGAKSTFKGRGLYGRFFWCLPTSTVGTRAGQESKPISADIERVYLENMNRLLELPLEHEDTVEGAMTKAVLKLSDAARSEYVRFWDNIEERHGQPRPGDACERDLAFIQDWSTKLQSAVLRIAGILHYAKHFEQAPRIEISEETMKESIDFCHQSIPHAKAAYTLMLGEKGGNQNKEASTLYRLLLCSPGMTQFDKEQITSMINNMEDSHLKVAKGELSRALSTLETHNILAKRRLKTGGRPKDVWFVNPSIYRERPK